MCGRFTLTRRDFRELAALLGADVWQEHAPLYRPRYNIAPTDQHWMLRQKREERQLLPAKWGLVNSWAENAKGAFKQINARSESAARLPAFRDAFARRRCLVPADGFFEWRGAKDARQPFWFHPPDDGLLLFAGLYESWRNPQDGEWQRTFTILTTDANETVSPVHDRMPAILPAAQVDEWLFTPPEGAPPADAGKLRALLRPAPSGALVATEVSPRVNSVKNDDPSVLDPPSEAPAEQARLM